jgi:hypothetical protein
MRFTCSLVAKILTEVLEDIVTPIKFLGGKSFSCEGNSICTVCCHITDRHVVTAKPITVSYVRFQVVMMASMGMAVFWVVVLCSLIESPDVSEVLALSIIRAVSHCPDGTGSSYL